MSILAITDERAAALLPVYLITVGSRHRQEPRHRPEGAVFHHILYVEKGEGVFETPNGNFVLHEGTAVFIRKEVPVSYYKKGDAFETAWVTFDGGQVDTILEYFHAKDFAFLESELIRSMILNVFKLAERNASPEFLSKNVYEMIITFFDAVNSAQKPPVLLRAKKYIEENHALDLSVSDIARVIGISESLLFRLFRDEEHTTPIDFLRKVRIRHAEQLLLSDHRIRISEVGLRCGFSDPAYFCKVFREATGLTPKIYQKRYTL